MVERVSPGRRLPRLAAAAILVISTLAGTARAQAQQAPAAPGAWYERVQLGAFVDTYYSLNYRMPRPAAGTNRYHPYNQNGGFGLAWVGLDASVEPQPVGGTLQLRFGPAVPNLALADFALPGGIGNVQNGFISWRPAGKDGKLTLVAGKFDTVFGAEVAQSQLNVNYTRGVLYNLAQPFFHTGLRADWAASDAVTVKLLAVNGWNNTLDNNRMKSFGAQIAVAPTEKLSLAAGYLGGPEQTDTLVVSCAAGTVFDAAGGGCAASDPSAAATITNVDVRNANARWRHLFDVVVDARPTESLKLVANGTFVTESVLEDPVTQQNRSVGWFGVSLIGRYAFSKVFAVGVRGEYLRDKDAQISAPNTSPVSLYTGTLTLEAAASKYLLIRLDNRLDAADGRAFPRGLNGTAAEQLTTTLGIVAKTN